jgi:threonine dehydrogenase-like Zn-dependent dehydrogenase
MRQDAAVLVALAQGAARVVAVGRNTGVLDRLAQVDPRVRTVALSGDRARDAAAMIEAGGEVDVVIDALVPGAALIDMERHHPEDPKYGLRTQ